MSLIFGRQVFETLAQLASAVITQITRNQTDYNTLHSMVQAATAAAQAAHPGATLFYVTFSDDPYGVQGGWVRQICVCHNTAAVTTHWDSAVEFPMIASNGNYYADLSGAKTVQNVTGSSIGTFTPAPPASDGTTGGGTTPQSLTAILTPLNGASVGFTPLAASDNHDAAFRQIQSQMPMTRRMFWDLLYNWGGITYNGTAGTATLNNGTAPSDIVGNYPAGATNLVDGVYDVINDYAYDNYVTDAVPAGY